MILVLMKLSFICGLGTCKLRFNPSSFSNPHFLEFNMSSFKKFMKLFCDFFLTNHTKQPAGLCGDVGN